MLKRILSIFPFTTPLVKKDVDVLRSANSISLCWKDIVPSDSGKYDGYSIKYRVNTTKSFQTVNIHKVDVYEYTIDELQSDTEYEIKIYTVDDGTEKELYKTVVKTECSLAKQLFGECKESGGSPTRHTMKPSNIKYIKGNVRMCYYGNEVHEDSEVEEKTVIVLGETGSGKSTLLDAMFNYLAGVTREDDFRFQLIHLTEQEAAKLGKQTESQTNGITCYHIPKKSGSAINFKLCVIDTPGFGDSRGKEFDTKIPTEINELFSQNIEILHAICLVVKASSMRLTYSQKYIFTNIMELFGKDVKGNIFALLTHDDGASGRPKVLDLIRAAGIEIGDDAYFRYNNANLFSKGSSSDVWKARHENFRHLFRKLATIDPISLRCTKEVLKARKKLANDLQHVAVAIRTNVNDTLKFEKDKKEFLKYETEMREHKAFQITRMVEKPDVKKKTYNSLNCVKCSKTCHSNCWVCWPFDFFKWTCCVFQSKRCSYCHCDIDSHEIQDFIHTTKMVEEIVTIASMKKIYDVAEIGAVGQRKLLDKNKEKMRQSLTSLDKTLDQASILIAKLKKVALKPEYETVIDFLKKVGKKDHSEANNESQDVAFKTEIFRMFENVIHTKEKEKPLTDLLDKL